MQLTNSILALVAATSAMAAPAINSARAADSVSAMADVPQWTFNAFTRTCNADDTSCTISFDVDTHLAAATHCAYSVTAAAPAKASRASVNGVTCGAYTISSGWSGQFGEGNGFTTWSVVDWSKRLITWPAYSDRELVNGVAVTPNKSFAPTTLS
ncbi:hypothetical protein B0H63DRAFT_471283 [Podospora didyma]|uniref:Small secreted protein n=1 Tax=Podospora didyma TaxID=330526 RepID=A0AAE0NUH9_9PEZI|nr:hypothetical protein B0H63DRAFT_471283 [Podospora didyma]